MLHSRRASACNQNFRVDGAKSGSKLGTQGVWCKPMVLGTAQVKQILKRWLPKPAVRALRQLQWRRGKARYARYPGNSEAVLQCRIAYNKYGGYCIPLSSLQRPSLQAILAGGVWEPDTIEFMINNIGTGDVVHAGAYFGDFLPALSRACKSGKVWAFEPNPENYRCAEMTKLLNGLDNVEIRNAGLGAAPERMSMMVADDFGRALGGASRFRQSEALDNSVIFPWHQASSDSELREHFAEAEVVCLDQVLPADARISIIQLDVEGYEQPALMGAMGTIRRCKPILILELFSPDQRWLQDSLFTLGYRQTGKLHDNLVFAAA
jgi:FkbM family methyltransferase